MSANMTIQTYVDVVMRSSTADAPTVPFQGGARVGAAFFMTLLLCYTRLMVHFGSWITRKITGGLAGLVLLGGAANAAEFTASNGVILPAPDINTLSCAELTDLMWTYSDSFYRVEQLVPQGHPDRPIYEYENRLAETHYSDCQMGTTHFENVSPSFATGFN